MSEVIRPIFTCRLPLRLHLAAAPPRYYVTASMPNIWQNVRSCRTWLP